MTHCLLHTWNIHLNYHIKNSQQEYTGFHKHKHYFYECIVCLCNEKVSQKTETVGFNSDTGNGGWPKGLTHSFPPSVCAAFGLWSCWAEWPASALGISHLRWPWPATGRAHHTLVCHFWPREPIGHEHMLSPRANTGHPSRCRLSSTAMCTRPAMRTKSDDVPRKTRAGVWVRRVWGWIWKGLEVKEEGMKNGGKVLMILEETVLCFLRRRNVLSQREINQNSAQRVTSTSSWRVEAFFDLILW